MAIDDIAHTKNTQFWTKREKREKSEWERKKSIEK